MYKKLVLTPEFMGRIQRKFFGFRNRFPEGMATNVLGLVEVLSAPDSAIYEIGDFGGVAYFNNITSLWDRTGFIPEASAGAHVMIWDRDYLRRPDVGQEIAKEVMETYKLVRLFTEIPQWNSLAIQYAKAIGFREIGRMRNRFKRQGQLHSGVLMDALRSDLEGASHGKSHRISASA